jgi:symplekin
MQLPAPQLSDALTICPELKEPLKEHLMNFTEGQRSHIPLTIQEIILGPYMQHPSGTTAVSPTVPPPVTTPTEDAVTTEPAGQQAAEPLPPGME